MRLVAGAPRRGVFLGGVGDMRVASIHRQKGDLARFAHVRGEGQCGKVTASAFGLWLVHRVKKTLPRSITLSMSSAPNVQSGSHSFSGACSCCCF